MAHFLTIDIGNSSIKAALWHDDRIEGDPLWGKLHGSDIAKLCAGVEIRAAAVCSVTKDTAMLEAASALTPCVISVSSATPLPISIEAYQTQATLGPDRIAALCAARALAPGCDALVVDCGTAITFDRLSADGRFLGGNISPGIGMRLRALHKFTSKLPLVDSVQDSPLWGRSTAEAMQSGAIYGAIAEIEYYLRQCPEGTTLALTGGRCQHLSTMIDWQGPIIVDPHLVLRGLKYIIDYNENI